MKCKLWIALSLLSLFTFSASPARADTPVVQAVLFYSPSCPYCQQVLKEALRPLQDQYGEQLQIFMVDVTQPEGHTLFEAAGQRYSLGKLYVPTLVMGEVVLVGAAEITDKLPALIEQHLAGGGAGWPDVPGLADALATAQLFTTPSVTGAATAVFQAVPLAPTAPAVGPVPSVTVPVPVLPASPPGGIFAKFARDPLGNGLAVGVLLWMILIVGRTAQTLWRGRSGGQPVSIWRGWLIPALCLLGSAVAAYLLYVEFTQVEAVCGPVGDCEAVQQSDYARLFGTVPISLLGLSGYAAILLTWWLAHNPRWHDQALAALFGLPFAGTLLSIYLTFLEPFVIGSVCIWCLTSAIIMTALLWLTVLPGRAAFATLLRSQQKHP